MEDKNTARWLSEKTDKARSCLIHLLYGKHRDDPAGCNMVFGTGTKNLDEITALVIDALSEKEKYNAKTARRLLIFFVPILDVYPEGEHLILRGVTHSPKKHNKIEDKGIAGDMPLKCELYYR